jgi:hypothetical protein
MGILKNAILRLAQWLYDLVSYDIVYEYLPRLTRLTNC